MTSAQVVWEIALSLFSFLCTLCRSHRDDLERQMVDDVPFNLFLFLSISQHSGDKCWCKSVEECVDVSV